MIAAITLAVVSVTGANAAAAVSRAGHIEIAPNALVHAGRHTKRVQRPEQAKGRIKAVSKLVAMRPWIGGTHEPKELLARARHMESIGLDITVTEVSLAKTVREMSARDFWPRESLPVYGYGHHVDGYELRDLPAESPLRLAGIAEGDQLLGIDGHRLDDDSIKDVDTAAIQKRGWTLVELARADHHVVLSIRW